MIIEKKLIRALIIFLILVFFGCGSNPSSTSKSHVGMDLDTAIREAATQMETRIPSRTMVALVSLASPSTAFSTQVLTRLESAIVSNGKLIVVDRANLDKVRAEQGFQLSGEVDDESAKSIGKLLGAGAIVTGSLTDLGDVFSLTLKAINIETATVAVSYLADLTKTTRIETLLATRDGAGSGGTSTAAVSRPASTVQTVTVQQSTPVAPVQYIVTFNANGASGTVPSAQTVQNGESVTVPNVGTMTNTRGNFGGWNTRANGNGTSYAAGSTFIVNANTQLFAQWIEHVYKIGDTGPAGGTIFFDKRNSSGGWRYLEAAPASTEGKDLQWSVSAFITGAKGEEVGTGKLNTTHIMDASVQAAVNAAAARYCDRLQYGGYEDWYLPSKNELGLMYMNLKADGIGGFGAGWYWSSSEIATNRAWIQNFQNGQQHSGNPIYNTNSANKGLTFSVRAIRQF